MIIYNIIYNLYINYEVYKVIYNYKNALCLIYIHI